MGLIIIRSSPFSGASVAYEVYILFPYCYYICLFASTVRYSFIQNPMKGFKIHSLELMGLKTHLLECKTLFPNIRNVHSSTLYCTLLHKVE